MRTLLLGLSLLSFTAAALAETANTQTVPAFKNGLNVPEIIKCEDKYKTLCKNIPSEATNVSANPQDDCAAAKITQDKSCEQASEIRKLISYPASHFKKYGDITVIHITTFADGIDMFYMVDKSGNFINLTDNINLDGNSTYQKIKREYPAAALTTILDWTKPNENLFPVQQKSANGEELVFRQTLRDGGCVACKTVGSVNVAYQFSTSGIYQGVKVLSVDIKK